MLETISETSGIPKEVRYCGRLMAHSGDIEFADQVDFFCVTQPSGKKGCEARPGVFRYTSGAQVLHLEVSMRESPSEILRRQSLTATGEVRLQDFVCRYLVRKRDFPIAMIGRRTISHSNRNVWHQYATDRVMFQGRQNDLAISSSADVPSGWRLEHYVRDAPGENWVVHARIMPHRPCALWLKWDTRVGRVLDIRNQRSLELLQSSRIGKALWYAAERRGGSPNLQMLGLGCLQATERLTLATRLWVQ